MDFAERVWIAVMLGTLAVVAVGIYQRAIVCPPICEGRDMRCDDVTMLPPWGDDFRCICAPSDRVYLKAEGAD